MNWSETHNINQMKENHEYLQLSAENYMFSHYSEWVFSTYFCCDLMSRSKNIFIASVAFK